ncbi:MAG: uracil-DNA glycosylase [Archangium sp.]|nr:uracil-DNA glycosylase [Archangium sp.]
MSLPELVPQAWKAPLSEATSASSFTELSEFLDTEWRDQVVFPPKPQVFAALELTPPEEVRVVLLGQDPYPTAGNANGLAFSVTKEVKVPASLKNVFLGLQADLGLPLPSNGDLTPWARRGVLLLNAVLTVREKTPQSHQKKGWEAFTTAVLRHVASSPRKVVFLCFGKPALKLVESLGTQHPIVAAPHPSPLNGRAFVDAVTKDKLFTKVNSLLEAPIDWSL